MHKISINIISIIMFIVIFTIIIYFKPLCFFNNDGSIREFGIGHKNKTIFPIWIMSIYLGILCYIISSYYYKY